MNRLLDATRHVIFKDFCHVAQSACSHDIIRSHKTVVGREGSTRLWGSKGFGGQNNAMGSKGCGTSP